MSTRSVIARGTPENFVGVYHHWDGYPTALGEELFNLVTDKYKGDLGKFLAWVIDKHTAGWSTLMGSSETNNKPECFCHPKRKRKAELGDNFFTQDNSEGDIEWIYIFDETNRLMYVIDNNKNQTTMKISLDTFQQPDWTKIECGCKFERCSHYAEVHFPELRGGPSASLSTAAYLGYRPLEGRDAMAVIINGVRYKLTGSGYSAAYRGYKGAVPPNTWISTVEDPNGFSRDLPTAIVNGNGHTPFPGVTLVLPPTKKNPNETKMTAPKVIVQVKSETKVGKLYDDVSLSSMNPGPYAHRPLAPKRISDGESVCTQSTPKLFPI